MIIYKYPIELRDSQVLSIPKGARELKVDVQYDRIVMWAMVDQSQPKVDVVIKIHGTGHEMGDKQVTDRLRYIDTVQLDNFVWHVFIQC